MAKLELNEAQLAWIIKTLQTEKGYHSGSVDAEQLNKEIDVVISKFLILLNNAPGTVQIVLQR